MCPALCLICVWQTNHHSPVEHAKASQSTAVNGGDRRGMRWKQISMFSELASCANT